MPTTELPLSVITLPTIMRRRTHGRWSKIHRTPYKVECSEDKGYSRVKAKPSVRHKLLLEDALARMATLPKIKMRPNKFIRHAY